MSENVLGNELLTLRQVADLVGTHLATAYRWALSGRLRGFRRGGRIVALRSDLEAFLKPVEPRQPPPAKPARVESRQAEAARKQWVEDELKRWRLV